jgi:hypothetical protein
MPAKRDHLDAVAAAMAGPALDFVQKHDVGRDLGWRSRARSPRRGAWPGTR